MHFDNSKNKWKCTFHFNKIRRNLGYFENEVDAANSFDKFHLEHDPDFTLFNFPEN